MPIQPVQTLPIGYELDKKFIIYKVISQCLLSVTYLAEHKHFETKHVITEYLLQSAKRDNKQNVSFKSNLDSEGVEWGLKRFYQEAKQLNQLHHPNLSKVAQLITDNGTAYCVTPLFNNSTLELWIKKYPNPTTSQILEILLPLLEGLEYLHYQGLLHKDINPKNIMITKNRMPVLVNFSGAKQDIAVKYNVLDKVLSPPYYAPELLDNNSQSQNTTTFKTDTLKNEGVIHAHLDLYSLSACMYQLITGKQIPEAKLRQLDDTLKPLSANNALLSTYPASLLQVIDKNLSLVPNERFQSAKVMKDTLTKATELTATAAISNGFVPTASTSMFDTTTNVATTDSNAKTHSSQNEPVNVSSQSPVYDTSSKKDTMMSQVSQPMSKRLTMSVAGLFILIGAIMFGVYFFNKPLPTSLVPISVAATSPSVQPDDYNVNIEPNEYNTLKVDLTIQGSNTIGAKLMPALLNRYYESNKHTALTVATLGLDDYKLIYKQPDGIPIAINLGSHGSSTGIEALGEKTAQLAMSSRSIKAKEVSQLLQLGLGDMQSEAQEMVIGLDGIAVIVNKANPIHDLTIAQLRDIFTGKVTNWSQVGGKDGDINLYVRDKKSGTRDTFDSLVLDKQSLASADAYEDSLQLSDTVSNDTNGIGYIGLPYVKNAKALAIAASDDSMALMPTSFTVSTEDYPLARRLYLYLPEQAETTARELVDFTLSKEGQQVVHDIGFIDIMPSLVKVDKSVCDQSENTSYKLVCDSGKRMDTNFRFATNSSELDNKAKQSLRMVTQYLNDTKNAGEDVQFTLIGFADNRGDTCLNKRISQQRAQTLATELSTYGVNISVIQGMGSHAPVADNTTETGRQKNRRVELWTVPSDVAMTLTDNTKKQTTC